MDTRIFSKISVVVAIIAAALAVLGAPATATPPGDITPEAITAGPDGNLWFTESGGAAKGIGRITPAGVITEYPVPDSGGVHRWGIAPGPDGNLWFTETFKKNAIGRITPTGVVKEFPVFNAAPTGIAAGPDGNMWWASEGTIGKIGLDGVITQYPLPKPAGYSFSANGIVAGPDGNMWFTQMTANTIGRITPAGVITQFPLSTTPWSRPVGIAAGPDGNLWFTENGANKIGRITTDGAITEYPTPTADGPPYGIAAGPDGNMWFTEPGAFKIGRITPTGSITEYQLHKAGSRPYGIAAGPDGNMWFTEPAGNRIGRITPAGVITEYPIPTPAVVKQPCPVNVTLHKPIPTTVGHRILTDKISTTTASCVVPKPVVLCRPLARTVAGEKAFCTTKVTSRGQIRVSTEGYRAVRVTVIVRAKPRPSHADSWKPATWRKNWSLR